MKMRAGLFGLLVTVLLQLSVFAGMVLAADISGTVEYAGAKTGRVFITVPQTQMGTLGTSVVFNGSNTSVPFTIRGVPNDYPNANYTVKAFLDPTGKGIRHASDPIGSVNIVVNGNLTGVTVTIAEPETVPTPNETLVDLGVLHGSGADMLSWTTSSDQGVVAADSYNLYWSTDADVLGTYSVSGGFRTDIPANDDSNIFFNTTLAETPYFYAMKSVVNGEESSNYSSGVPLPEGTGSTISGVVELIGGNPPGKQLFVVIGSDANDGGPSNFAVITTSGPTQAFSIPGVPNGNYWIFPVFDMNDNGLLDDGDISVSENAAGYAEVAGSDVDAGTISFASSNVDVTVMTNYWKSSGSTGYSLRSELFGNSRTPVKVTFTGGTGMPEGMAVDVGLSGWGGFDLWTNIDWIPQVGDAYTVEVIYADDLTETPETVTAYVTAVLDSLPTPVEPLSAIPYDSGTPTFSWDAPASTPPDGYGYSLSVWGNNGNFWWYPDNDIPAMQTSVEFNFDNSASQPALTDGETYRWRIAVFDRYGNSASSEAGFTYAGAIAGVVLDDLDEGIQNVWVSVCRYDSGSGSCNGGYNGTNTDENGAYVIVGLPEGEYKVQFYGANAGYMSSWYDGTTDFNSAQPVAVSMGYETGGIDAWLTQGGSISGTVTNGVTGIQNVNVQVCQWDSGTSSCNWSFSGTNTDASGNYTLAGLPPGDYKVQFNAASMGYINEWYNDTTDMNAAAPQTVSEGSIIEGIDAVLAIGGSISGRVTNGVSGLANIGVSVYATNNGYNQIGWTNTDSNGYYTLAGLAAGDYKVYFYAGQTSYASRWYNNKVDFNSALTVSVTAANITPLADAVLVTAVYYDVTASAEINGYISPWGVLQVLSGDSQVFFVTAYFPHVIDAVGGTCGGTLNDTTYTTNAITQNCTVTLVTKPISYLLTVNTAGTGSGNVTGAGTYNHGDNPMLTATPTDGNSIFAGWSGDCGGTEASVSVLMYGPKSCTATFTAVAQHPPAKIGVFTDGYWYLDTNQSWAWDGTPTDSLGMFGLGIVGATPVAGDWNSDGKTEIGVFIDGIWYLDMNGNGQWDGEVDDVRGVFGVGVPNAKPVVGAWTDDGKTKIGIYADGIWYLDANQSWAWDGEVADIRGVFGVGLPNAKPVTGDWNADTITEIGVYSEGNWYLDKNRSWAWEGVPTDTYGVFGAGLPNVVPVTGDWNGDGITKIGVYSDGDWYLDTSNSWAWEGVPTDTYGAFGTGLPNVTPVVGNW